MDGNTHIHAHATFSVWGQNVSKYNEWHKKQTAGHGVPREARRKFAQVSVVVSKARNCGYT